MPAKLNSVTMRPGIMPTPAANRPARAVMINKTQIITVVSLKSTTIPNLL